MAADGADASELPPALPALTGSGTQAATAATSAPDIDDASRSWLQRLTAVGAEQEAAVLELHALLVEAARFTVARRRAMAPQLAEASLDELATDAADEALVAVLARLDEFRGGSRFTTWAAKFAFLQTATALRRGAWIGRRIPSEAVDRRESLAELRQAVETDLTPRQRRVFVALALNEVPIDVVAERLGSCRADVYEVLHDARCRLRVRLAQS